MNRRDALARSLLAAAALCAIPWPAMAADNPVYVVKQILFTCPACRASETLDSAIGAAASETGGKLVYAPLPVDGDVGAPMYYAARAISESLADQVRQSFYKATQDMGLELNEQFRAYVWLQQDLQRTDVDWAALLANMQSATVKSAMARSLRLARDTGVAATPSYVLIVNGQAVEVIDPTTVSPPNSLAAVRQAVLAAIKRYSTKSAVEKP